MNEKQSEEAYITLFCEIFTTVLKQIEHRFSGLQELQFLEILNPHHFLIYKEKFPDENYLSLKKHYSDFFDLPDLKTELSVIYTSSDFEKMFPNQICKYIHDKGLKDCVPQIYKLSALLSCIPSSSASVERSFSRLKHIKTFERNSMSQQRLSGLTLITCEKELLGELQKSDHFYEKVISKFTGKARIEFTYQ